MKKLAPSICVLHYTLLFCCFGFVFFSNDGIMINTESIFREQQQQQKHYKNDCTFGSRPVRACCALKQQSLNEFEMCLTTKTTNSEEEMTDF